MLLDLATVDHELILLADFIGMDARDRAAAHDQFGDALVVENERAFFSVWDQVRSATVWLNAERGQIQQATHEALRRAFLQLRRACQRGDCNSCKAICAQVLWQCQSELVLDVVLGK